MGIETILARIPWKEILKQAPLIVEAARKLYEGTKKDSKPSKKSLENVANPIDLVNSLQLEIEDLKTNEVEQAKLVSNMAIQVKTLSDALQVVSSRLSIFIGISIISLVPRNI